MSERGFSIESVLLCDDVRKEDNGKVILIGVYSGAIIIPEVPANLALSVWFQLRAEEAANHLAMRAKLEHGDSTVSIVGGITSEQDFRVEPGDQITVATEKLLLQIVGPGHLLLQVKFGDREWTELMRKPISVDPNVAREQQRIP
jgi:hypothetical protein